MADAQGIGDSMGIRVADGVFAEATTILRATYLNFPEPSISCISSLLLSRLLITLLYL
jgi:hypothetical protein